MQGYTWGQSYWLTDVIPQQEELGIQELQTPVEAHDSCFYGL